MRIFFDYKIFYQQRYGGISSYFSNLGLNLIKKKLDLSFLVPLHINYNLDKIPKKNIIGKKIIYPGILKPIINKINFKISEKVIQNQNPEILHSTYFSKNTYNSKSIKVITFYDLTHEIYKKFNSDFKQLKKDSLINADHIFCPSRRVKEDVIDYYKISEKKMTVTYFSSDFDKINLDDINKPRKLKNYLLYVGNRSNYKNFENLVEAYSKSEKLKKDFKILIFGGEKSNICGEKLFVEKKLPKDCFKFVNGSNDNLKNLYRNVRALIYTSKYEGFGIPLIEAMRSGCPIITSFGGALKEVGGEDLNYFDPINIEDIKNKIENLVYSESEIEKSVRYGLKRSDMFSWSKCADESLKIYKSLSNC